MGNWESRIKNGRSRGKTYGKNGRNGQAVGNDASTGRGEEYEDIELMLLRRAIQKDPESFVLNNLMMCVQFFRNYEEEIEHVKETLVSSREAELNERLPPQKHVLLPDVLQEQISRNVGFSSIRQTFRPTIEPLQPVRIYTVHDNIDITEENYSSHYSSVNDSVMYNILLRPTEHQGYVQLQLLEEFGSRLRDTIRAEEADLSSIAENDDELFSDDGESVYGPKPRSNILLGRRGKQRGLMSGSKNGSHTRSLPNLHDQKEAGSPKNPGAMTRSGRIAKAVSDYENGSSAEERSHRSKRTWSKGELARGEKRSEKQVFRTKLLGSSSQSRASSASSGYRSGNYAFDSDSSCNPSQNSTLAQSSNDEEIDEDCIISAELPSRSFKRVTYTADGKIYDPKEERKPLMNSNQRRIKLALRRHNYDLLYISSTEFMRHFMNVFAYRLADSFGFDRESVEEARREGCVLYCDKVMMSSTLKVSRVEQYEIMPAIWLQWPICAQEWLDRPRSTWPDYNDIEKIKDFGCYVVPEGFVPRRGSRNLIQDLEWQLTFPTAERYLETCMTQAQVQVYLISLMLHKTFMRPVFDTMFGLTTAHIRHKMFWLIEENDRPLKWPDNRMGDCMLTLLNSLYHGISQNEPTLRDYFVRDRNLFQRVPCDHLLHTQKQLKRIIENPVMYLFHAMENILHNENFFPRLDFEMLLRILTVDTLTLVNPALARYISRPIPQNNEHRVPQDERYIRAGFWDTVKNQPKKHSTHIVTNKTFINPRKATDSIIEISIRSAELEVPRLCALLDFFIRHFIKLAERCYQYRAYRQKLIYLDQADRLSILLFEHQRFKDDARAYRDKIKVLRKKNTNSKTRDDPPKTPKRNPEPAIFVAPLKDRFAPEPTERVSISSGNSSAQRDQSDQNTDDSNQNFGNTQTVTKAIVHEVRFNEPDQENTNDETAAPISPIKLDQYQQVISLSESPDPLNNESTYI